MDMREIDKVIEQFAINWNKKNNLELKLTESNKKRNWQVSEPFELVGRAVSIGTYHWITGFIAGLKINQDPDTIIQFWLTSIERSPGEPESITTSSEDVSSNNFDTYNYQEFQTELAEAGMVVVVREAVGTGWIVILGLVQNNVNLIQISVRDSTPIDIVPSNNSFLTIIGPGRNALDYAPVSISIFDTNNKIIGQQLWPSQKQL